MNIVRDMCARPPPRNAPTTASAEGASAADTALEYAKRAPGRTPQPKTIELNHAPLTRQPGHVRRRDPRNCHHTTTPEPVLRSRLYATQ